MTQGVELMARCTSGSLALALGFLALLAPALALAQEQPSAAGDQPTAESDQDGMAPQAEPKIDAPFGAAWLGAADADVTLVVFADYACPGCREAQPVLDQLLAQDRKLRIVYRLLDNDQGGRNAALTSLAVAKQAADWGKFHHALDAAGDVDAKAIAAALSAASVDPAKLPDFKDETLETDALKDELNQNDAFINQRKGDAIPAWVIGDGAAQKGFDLPRLQAAVAEARKGKAH
jgi:protein-disulfide isomerase